MRMATLVNWAADYITGRFRSGPERFCKSLSER